jgi:hypothetical protein
MYAREVYWRDGASVEIPDEGGQNSPYQPSEREVASRKSYLEMRQSLRPPYGSAIFGIVFVAMSVMLGLLTPLSKRPPGSHDGGAPANNRLKQTARGRSAVDSRLRTRAAA